MVLKHFAHEQSAHISKWLDLDFDSDEYYSYIYESIPKIGEYCHLVNRISIKLKANDTKYLEDNLSFFSKSSKELQLEYILTYIASVFNHKSWHCKPIFIDETNLGKDAIQLNRIFDICCKLHCPITLLASGPLDDNLLKQAKYLSSKNLFNIILNIPSTKLPICKLFYNSDKGLWDRIKLLKQGTLYSMNSTVLIGPVIPKFNYEDLEEIINLIIQYTDKIQFQFISLERFESYYSEMLPMYLSEEELKTCRTYVKNYHGLLSTLMEEEQFISRYEKQLKAYKLEYGLDSRLKKLSTSRHKYKKSNQLSFF